MKRGIILGTFSGGYLFTIKIASSRQMLRKVLRIAKREYERKFKNDARILRVRRKKDGFYFTEDFNGKEKGITKDKKRIYALCRKRYLEYIIPELEWEISRAETTLKWAERRPNRRRVEEFLKTLADAGLDLGRITMTQKQLDWKENAQSQNPFHREQLIFETSSGVKMRSKAEVKIGEMLERLGIPYRYEPAIVIDVFWMQGEDGGWISGTNYSGEKTYYPDFVIMCADGSLIIWEHLGRVDLQSYRIGNSEKLMAYRGSGVIEFDRIITTYEADLRSADTLERIINERVLPYV